MRTIEVTGDPKQIDRIFHMVERTGEPFILAHGGIKKCIIKPIHASKDDTPLPRSRKVSSH